MKLALRYGIAAGIGGAIGGFLAQFGWAVLYGTIDVPQGIGAAWAAMGAVAGVILVWNEVNP